MVAALIAAGLGGALPKSAGLSSAGTVARDTTECFADIDSDTSALAIRDRQPAALLLVVST